MNHKLIKFLMVGGVGFIVDLCTFSLCVYLLKLSFYESRVIAFFVALTATWLGNRLYTFVDVKSAAYAKEWAKFAFSACLSAIPNFVVFSLILKIFGEGVYQGFAALALGVIAGALTNYFMSSRWVFSSSKSDT